MTTPRWLASVAATMLLSACPPSSSTSPPPTVVPEEPVPMESLGDDVFIQAKAQGPTEDEAYAAARAALAEALLGDAAWAELVPIDVHRRGQDPQRARPTSEGMELAVGLTRARAAEVLSDFGNGEVKIDGPQVWRDTLHIYLHGHRAAHACVRRNMLFQARCETGETDHDDDAVADLAQGLLLVSAYPDGIPVDAEGKPLRTPILFALWRGVPLADLPVRIDTTTTEALTETHLRSDAQGRIHIPLTPGVPLPSMRVMLDADALLGPRRSGAPKAELKLEPRTVGTRRWSLVATRQGSAHDDDQAAAAVLGRMSDAGLGAPVTLSARDAKTLRGASAQTLPARLATIADTMSGELDLLLVLSYRTRFASRMGGGRIWYEAEGTLRAVDVWTGEVRAEAKTTVGAEGVGDDAADVAARTKLGRTLSAQVIDTLR